MQNNQVYKDFKEGMIIPRETPLMKKKTKRPSPTTKSLLVNMSILERKKH